MAIPKGLLVNATAGKIFSRSRPAALPLGAQSKGPGKCRGLAVMRASDPSYPKYARSIASQADATSRGFRLT
jgi:hypothetical protein